MDRVPTGIEGFDKLIEGGFPQKSSILVCGMPGTGKTLFALQYLYNGATKFGDKGLYVTIDENADKIRLQAEQFGWDLQTLERKGLISFLEIPVDQARYDILKNLEAMVKKTGAARIVFDSVSVLAINCGMYVLEVEAKRTEEGHYVLPERTYTPSFSHEIVGQFMYILLSRINKYGLNIIFIGDSPDENRFTKDGVTEFICDGLISMKVMNIGNTLQRTLELRKMRSTNLQPGIYAMEFTNKGLKIGKFNY